MKFEDWAKACLQQLRLAISKSQYFIRGVIKNGFRSFVYIGLRVASYLQRTYWANSSLQKYLQKPMEFEHFIKCS